MRPPILFLTIAFGVGLWGGLGPSPGRGAWYVVAPLLVAATLLLRRAPLGAAVGIMGVAGMLGGAAGGRGGGATCTSRGGGRGRGRGGGNPPPNLPRPGPPPAPGGVRGGP